MRCTGQFKEKSEEWHGVWSVPNLACWSQRVWYCSLGKAGRQSTTGWACTVRCNLTHNLFQSPSLTEAGGPGEETGGPDPGKARLWGRDAQAGREGQKRLSSRLRVGTQTGILGKDRQLWAASLSSRGP